MNRYDPVTRRTLAVTVAAAMSVLTLGLLVVSPTGITPSGRADGATAATQRDMRAPTLVVIEPSHIDVVGVRANSIAVVELASAVAGDLRSAARQPTDGNDQTTAHPD